MNKPDALISAFVDGTLSPDDQTVLESWITTNAAHADAFFESLMVHRAISRIYQSQSLSTLLDNQPNPNEKANADHLLASFKLDQDAASIILDVVAEDQAARRERAKQQQEALVQQEAETSAKQASFDLLMGVGPKEIVPVKRVVIPKAVFYGAIAAAMALTALLFWPNSSPPPQVVEVKPTPPQLVQVATLVEQVDAHWLAPGNAPGAKSPAPGDALLNQSMYLVSGLAKLRFNNDAEVILEAPCSIEPIAGDKIKITHGKLVGRCETDRSHGFVVQTPGARIVDLGTEFGVSVDQGVVQADVFGGRVQLHTREDGADKSLTLESGRGVDIAGDGRVVHRPAKTNYAKNWRDILYKPQLVGDVIYQSQPPALIGANRIESNKHAVVFLESESRQLTQSLWGAARSPGLYNRFNDTFKSLSGTVFDSYLIHFDPVFDPVNETTSSPRVTGRIVFPRPIIGVLATLEQLDASDDLCGNSRTRYESMDVQNGRGLESFVIDDPNADRLRISDDGRTLQFELNASEIDQFRVMIEPARKAPAESNGR